MIKAIIIDDEALAIEALSLMLTNFCPNVTVVATANSALQGIKTVNKTPCDVVFLDVDMPDGSGFDLLESVEAKFKVIFTTASSEHAVKAIKANASNYLLKPIDVDELIEAVNKLKINTTVVNQNNNITLQTLEGFQIVASAEIVRLEAQNNYTIIYLSSNKKLTISKTLKEFELELEPKGFFRVHQSHIINLAFVDKYIKGRGGEVVLKDGTIIDVSTRRRDDFLAIITNS